MNEYKKYYILFLFLSIFTSLLHANNPLINSSNKLRSLEYCLNENQNNAINGVVFTAFIIISAITFPVSALMQVNTMKIHAPIRIALITLTNNHLFVDLFISVFLLLKL